jgi:hypothetical protein
MAMCTGIRDMTRPMTLTAALLLTLVLGTAATAQSQRVTAETLTLEAIDKSIDSAIKALYEVPALQPQYTFPPEHALYLNRHNFHVHHMMGNQALVCWAMLAAGESYQNPPLYRRINWVLSKDQPLTYDRSMRLQMLAELPAQRWAPWTRRDAIWLSGSMTEVGNFAGEWKGVPIPGVGDNANGQYAVLGMWGAERSGFAIKAETWKKIDAYWRKAQQRTKDEDPAGWALFSLDPEAKAGDATVTFNKRISGPMTAGGVATLCLTERYLLGATMVSPGVHTSRELRKGLRWLDNSFSLTDKAEETDYYYYMWTIQRVGHATGYRTFNKIDWFREVTALMINQQRANGTWAGDKGDLLSTGFALLYLSKAFDPLAIGKVRFSVKDKGGQEAPYGWNNRPHDIWNFVDYISDLYEVSTSWQIFELDQPVYELIETPILYMSTDGRYELSEKQLNNVRQYIQAGGLLVINHDEATPDAGRSTKEMLAKLYPGKDPARLDKEHPFYTLHQPVGPGLAMNVIDNGIRPLVVHFQRDIGSGLQSNDQVRGANAESFRALSNIYLYCTGMNPRRLRLKNNYVPRIAGSAAVKLSAARIKHSGNWDPEPLAMVQLSNIVANRGSIDLQVQNVTPAELSQQRIAFLSTTGDGDLTDNEAAAVRRWVESGGTLWIDAAGGSAQASKKAHDLYAKIVPNVQPAPIGSLDPIISGEKLTGGTDNRRVRFRNYALKTMGPVNAPKLQCAVLNDRVAVVLSGEDLTCGLAGIDHWGIFGYTPEFARRLVVNGVLAVSRQPGPRPAAQ